MGISAKTGYKWRDRFLALGKMGLRDASRRPIRSPLQLPESVVCELVRLKRAHQSWGPEKVRELYRRQHGTPPSLSSCKRVLTKAGLVEPRRIRPRKEAGRIVSPIVAQEPNDLWTVDFKGWWRTRNGQRFEPLTVRDAYSRYILCAQAMSNNTTAMVRTQFERLFEENGLPRTIRSDNGTPFAASNALLGLSRLSAWWLALGIDLDRIRPGHPEENGAHERMHRDIRHEIQALISGDIVQQQIALDLWRECFNQERPHQALGMKTPSELYRRSNRSYTGTPDEIAYEPPLFSRTVNHCGFVKIHGNHLFLSESLCGWQVGMKADGPDFLEVNFAHLRLGRIDLTTASFLPVPSHRQERGSS